MKKLKGKTAVITGSTKGIGRAIAERFADEGAVVVVVGRDKSAGSDVVKTIEQRGGVSVAG